MDADLPLYFGGLTSEEAPWLSHSNVTNAKERVYATHRNTTNDLHTQIRRRQAGDSSAAALHGEHLRSRRRQRRGRQRRRRDVIFEVGSGSHTLGSGKLCQGPEGTGSSR